MPEKKLPSGTEIKQLSNSVRRLTRVAERLADTIRKLNASLESQNRLGGEQETETLPPEPSPADLSDQPIITYDDSYSYITVETVHGIRETIKFPRRNP